VPVKQFIPAASPTSPRANWAGLAFTELLSAGNLSAATACFTRDACLLTQDATAIHNRDAIRPVLAQLIARRARIAVELTNVLPSGDVALVRERWTIEIDGIESSRFDQICTPTMVLRRVEGRWKLALLAPWGWGEELAR
jgi:ketosteroid isomerase-like protein